MDDFRYKYGDRPLEGYTIQRAAGVGGFGEVYYAVSDSGRQVALKAVQNYEQIELRGIAQCMNLKSPHLVTIFDVRHNDQGKPFVIMEYVSGPSLRDLLSESPSGLGPQKAAFFLREIAKGLSFLHEGGIVHRDLKPSNIFYENGYVKIGDYGLAKAISASRHSAQTITVGTVHYMAPEIGAGHYDRSIDIYALGILLYEMLTGQVPFFGASPAEILMKHMTAEPDLTGVEEPFRRVIRKALAKNPADRYQTVQKMVEDLFGSEHIRNSVSQFAPEDLSVVAEHVAKKARLAAEGQPPSPSPTPMAGDDKWDTFAKKVEHFGRKMEAVGDKIAGRIDETAKRMGHPSGPPPAVADTLTAHQRRKLMALAMALVAVGAGLIYGGNEERIMYAAISTLTMTAVVSKVILASRKRWFANLEPDSRWLAKVPMCLLAGLAGTLVNGLLVMMFGIPAEARGGSGPFPRFPFSLPFGHSNLWLPLAIPLMLVDWWKITASNRDKRVSLGQAIWLGALGFVAAGIFGAAPLTLVVASVLAGVSLVVQIGSPFGPALPNGVAPPGGGSPRSGNGRYGTSAFVRVPVPPGARVAWLIAWLASLAFGLALVIWAPMGRLRGDEFAITLSIGIDSLVFSVLSVIMLFRATFTGWYNYLVRPLLLFVCVAVIVISAICLGALQPRDDEAFLGIMFIIFPSIGFVAVAAIPPSIFRQKPADAAVPAGISPFKRMPALIRAGLPLGSLALFRVPLPLFGLHRFYVGRIKTGILWFCTFGLLCIGQIIDVIMILSGQFKDRNGLPLLAWERNDKIPQPTPVVPAQPGAAAAAMPDPPIFNAAVPPPPAAPAPPPAPSGPASYMMMNTTAYRTFNPLASLLAAVGHILLLAAVLVGLFRILHVPMIVSAGWPDPNLAGELTKLFDYAAWPQLLEKTAFAVMWVLLLFAALFLTIGRRIHGPSHQIRAVIGIGGILLALTVFSDAVPGSWPLEMANVLKTEKLGPILESLMLVFTREEAIVALVFVFVANIILAWPPRRPLAPTPVPNQGIN